MKIIDLFAGAGGFSLGFEMEGFTPIFAIEKDENASLTYKKNHPKTMVYTQDITTVLDLSELATNFNNDIDGIIGGPPCQGFSLSGNRDKNDPRNSLFMEFVRFVKHFKPKFFAMENVIGLLSMKTKTGENVKDIILNCFNEAGYDVEIHILNAAEFGVPQSRKRIFFIGFRKDLRVDLTKFSIEGYMFEEEQVSIKDAIMDLPQIKACEGTEEQDYPVIPQNNYQRYCRRKSKKVYNHIAMKHTKRLVERFEQIKFGQSVKDVSEEYSQRQRGDASKVSGKAFGQNNFRPYPDKPSPTIPASFQSNFIHPYLNRNYTAREGARLQSFPDHYIFYGQRTNMSWDTGLSQYQQIGNAVPPLLAKAIAKEIKKYI